jgi:hypothetical protein
MYGILKHTSIYNKKSATSSYLIVARPRARCFNMTNSFLTVHEARTSCYTASQVAEGVYNATGKFLTMPRPRVSIVLYRKTYRLTGSWCLQCDRELFKGGPVLGVMLKENLPPYR